MLSKRTAISTGSLSEYERIRAPGPDNLAAIIKALGISAQWLLTGEGEMFDKPAPAQSLQILATASAADGRNRIAHTLHEPRSMRLPSGLHLVQVSGDSMIPIALPGQYVLCTMDAPQSGDLAVVELPDDEILFKRVYVLDGKIQCISVNPDPRFAPLTLRRTDVRRLHKVWGVKF